MEIGKRLKNIRMQKGLTQEVVAERIQVSRQTISNWENEKSYPDIVNIIHLSNLYEISLDALLKEDQQMIEHLQESTDVVKSNSKLTLAIIFNIIFLFLAIALSSIIVYKVIFLAIVFVLAIISFSILLYQIIKRI